MNWKLSLTKQTNDCLFYPRFIKSGRKKLQPEDTTGTNRSIKRWRNFTRNWMNWRKRTRWCFKNRRESLKKCYRNAEIQTSYYKTENYERVNTVYASNILWMQNRWKLYETYFGYIEKIQQIKISLSGEKVPPDLHSGRKESGVPSVFSLNYRYGIP